MIVTKIKFANKEFFGENKNSNFKSTRKSKIGPILLSLALASAVVANMNDKLIEDSKKVELPEKTSLMTINTDNEKLNNLNIILNNSTCSDYLFNGICSSLEEDGISFISTKNCIDINRDNSTVITLDQQYNAGKNTLIFAPYNNSRIGYSDSLAVSMKSSFEQAGFNINGLVCSQIGFMKDANGNVNYNVPTDTENAIDENNETSFVTISFGTGNIEANKVAKCIENGLARHKHYIDNYDNKTDLVYRANGDEEINVVADYFDSNPYDLKKYNNINNSTLSDSQAIINPQVASIDSFDNNCDIELNNIKEKVL